jgi:GntR family transcriptional regulator/MocR family aminotransferase
MRWVAEDLTHRVELQDHFERRPSFCGSFTVFDGIKSPIQNISGEVVREHNHFVPFAASHYTGSMSSRSIGISPIIEINREATAPLHKQIYDAYRARILRGDLRPGQQIPSSRDFASDIQVSRFPVLHAYAQLLAEGYFETRVGAGTFVSGSLPEQLLSVERQKSPSTQIRSGPRPVAHRSLLYPPALGSPKLHGWGAFGVHQPAFDQFPFQIWSNLVAQHSRNPSAKAIHYVNPLGSQQFRETICSYLRTARGVNCEANQVMVVSGSQQALDITARVLFDPGSRVLVEEPGYVLGRTVLAAAGCHLVPVPVDNEGMVIEEVVRRKQKARAAFVTPSHQFPLGSTMSASRRLHLLNWAQGTGSWVIEDDYDSEFRFESRPVASLQGLDVNARVIYIGTFSKVLFPSLRIGYIVIPTDLVERFIAVRIAMDIFPPYLYQEVLTDFMNQGHFGRHIRKMRQLYGERRTVLIESIREEFGDALEVHGTEAGMHLAVTMKNGISDRTIAARAAAERLWLWPLSPSYLGKAPRQGFVLGFGSVAANQIPRSVRKLRTIIGE